MSTAISSRLPGAEILKISKALNRKQLRILNDRIHKLGTLYAKEIPTTIKPGPITMPNLNLFQTIRGRLLPEAAATNDAGGRAYALPAEAALARMAATGCLNGTFYASAETQLDRVLDLARQVNPDFLARTALYARNRAFMKDMPALLCAVLAVRDVRRLEEIFPRVIDNGRMLRTFVQIVRSGVTGRKSLGSAPRRCVRRWLDQADDRRLLEASVGQSPSLADVVKMVRPRPADASREAFYGWLVGRPYNAGVLPASVRTFEAYKAERVGEPPDVPFQMLTALDLGPAEWKSIARRAGWQMTRMNLNTFARQGVLDDPEMVALLARRLANPALVRKARAFPYQLMAAYRNAGADVPAPIREALQDAMEIALANVPALPGRVVVCPDVSGSMQQPVTGTRAGSTSWVRCVDVAALVAASLLRVNRESLVLPFEGEVVDLVLNPRDAVITNADRLAAVGGGATNCSAPLARLNAQGVRADLVVFVSDNESWMDPRPSGRSTRMLEEWERFRQSNPQARLVCIDLVPNTTTQAPDREDILNIAGFSDAVFDLLATFASGADGAETWIREINQQTLEERSET